MSTVRLSTREFVGWIRARDLELPFPLGLGGVAYGPAPGPGEIAALLRARDLVNSRALAVAARVLAAPRQIVHAVRKPLSGDQLRIAAIAGHGPDPDAALISLDDEQVTITRVADTELVAGVVGALPLGPVAAVPTADITLSAITGIDEAITAGRPAEQVRDRMAQAGYPPALAAFRAACGDEPATYGVLGVLLARPGREPEAAGSTLLWREYPRGALLWAPRPTGRGETVVRIGPCSPAALLQAGVQVVAAAGRHAG